MFTLGLLLSGVLSLGLADQGTGVEEIRARLEEVEQLGVQAQRLAEAGQLAQAIPLVERQLELQRQLLGPKRSEVARSLNQLGSLYYSLGDLSTAQKWLAWISTDRSGPNARGIGARF